MENMNNQKFNKTINTIDKFLLLLRNLCIIAGVVCIVCIPLLWIFKDSVIKYSSTLDFEGIAFTIDSLDNYISTNRLIMYSVLVLLSTLVVIAVFIYGIHVFRKILEPMKEGRPFESGVAGQIRKMAIVIAVGGLISEGIGVIQNAIYINAIDIMSLLENTPITGVTAKYAIDGNILVIALVVFLLSYIFEYGEMLQQESDELL